MPGKYDIEGYGTYEIDSDDDAEIQSTISEIIAQEKAARASRPTLGGPTGLASKRLAALGGKPESEKGDFAPRPSIAGNAIPAIQPVNRPAIPEEPDAPSALLTPELQSFFRKNKQEALRKARENTFPSVGEMAGNVADWAGRQKAALDADLDREAAAQAAEDAAGEARHDKYIAPLERRVGDILTGAGAAAREAIGGYGDISPDATPIQRARLRRRAPAPDLAGGGVRKYEPPKAGEPYLPLGAGVEQYRPVSEQAAARLAALRSGDDGTVRRENARPLFEGKALGEAPATSRLNPEDTLRATAPARYLENDYTKVHDWAQGAADDLGKWATEDTEHSALARLVDRGEKSDSLTANVLAAGAKGVTQAITSSAPALAEFAVLHRATPGAFKPLVDAAITSWFSGEGVGQVAEASPAVGTDIGSAIGGDPVPFNELAQHLGQLGMGAFMGATPLGAKSPIAKSIEGNRFLDPGLASGRSPEQARLYGEATRGQADREMASRAISVEEGVPMIGAFNRAPITAPLTDLVSGGYDALFNRNQSEVLPRPRIGRSPLAPLAALGDAPPTASGFTAPMDIFDLASGRTPTPYDPEMGPERWEGVVPRLAPFESPVGPPVPYSVRERLAHAQLLEGQGPPDLSRAERAMHSIPSGPEGQVRGPFPVPPDVLAQGRTPPADLQARTGNAPRPAAPVDPEAARVLASILSGGEEPPPAPTLPARPPLPTVGDVPSWQDRQRAERASPAKPPAEENIQVEPKATTDAQLEMVEEGQGQPGKKPGVLYTVQGGAKPPDVVPEGLARVDGPAGTLIFDPTKVTPEQAREALTSGEGLDKALGFSGPRPEPHPDNAVVSVLGKDGVEKSSQVVGPGDIEGAVKAAQGMAGEGDQVAVRTPDEVIADRQAGIEAEKKPPRSYDEIQREIDAAEERLSREGVDVTKLAPAGELLGLPVDYRPMPSELEKLYNERYAAEAHEDAEVAGGLGEALERVMPDAKAREALVADLQQSRLPTAIRGANRMGMEMRAGRQNELGRIAEVAVRHAAMERGEGEDVHQDVTDRLAGTPERPGVEIVLAPPPPGYRPYSDGTLAKAQEILDAVVPGVKLPRPGKAAAAPAAPAIGGRGQKALPPAPREDGVVARTGTSPERRVEDKGAVGRPALPKNDDVRTPAAAKFTVEPTTEIEFADGWWYPEGRKRSDSHPTGETRTRWYLYEDGENVGKYDSAHEANFAIKERQRLAPPGASRTEAVEAAPKGDAPPEPGVRPAAEPVAPGARKALLDERAASIEERRELQRKIREDSLSPKKLARAKEELRETELHLKALDKKLGYGPGGPTAAQVEADLKERFGDRYEPDVPEPVEAKAEAPKGKPARVWVSPTEPLDVEYKIVEADTVRTSHDKRTGEPTPGFPQRKQPRDRSRESYLRQQAEIGQRPNPDLLLEGPEASVGAPITSEPGPEGIRDAEHGNGRTNGIRIAYEDGNAGEYRQRLIDDASRYGMTPEAVEGMREPILIRERKTDLSAKEQVSIAKESNKGTAERMGTAEQAAVDAGAMTPELLSQFAPSESGDIMAASNRPFLRGFFSEIADSGDMVDRAGNVSAAGVARVKAAILAKAYGETSVLERALEAADDNTRNVSAGLLSAAPRVAKVRAMAESGELHPVDFTTPIKEAVDHLAHARDQGVSVADYLDQQDLFGDQISPEGRDVLSFLDKNKRSPKKIAGFIDSLARAVEAAGHPDQTDLFGGAPDAPSRAETFASAKRIYESRFESEGTQTGLFDQTGSGGPDRGAGPGAAPGGGGGAPGGGRPGGGEPGGKPRVFAYSSGKGVGRDPYAERTGKQAVPVPTFKRLPRTPPVRPPEGPLEVLKAESLVPAYARLKNGGQEMLDDIHEVFSATTVSDSAKRTADIKRKNYAQRDFRMARLDTALRPVRDYFDKLRPADRMKAAVDFIGTIERQDPKDPKNSPKQATPELEKHAALLRAILDASWREVEEYGYDGSANYLENYFPRIFEKPDAAARFAHEWYERRSAEGSKGFLHKRYYELLDDALATGLKLADDNPADIVKNHVAQVQQYLMWQKEKGQSIRERIWRYKPVDMPMPEGYDIVHPEKGVVYGDPSVAVGEAVTKRFRLMEDIAKDLNIQHERLAGVGGEFGRAEIAANGDGKVVTRFGTPVGVLAHEVGHVLDQRYKLWDALMSGDGSPTIRRELRDLADLRYESKPNVSDAYKQYVRTADEQIANMLDAYVSEPGLMRELAPVTLGEFRKFLLDKPELHKFFDMQPGLELEERVTRVPVKGKVIIGHWIAPRPVVTLIDRSLTPGLQNKLWYRTFRGLTNVMNQIQLGMSGFHAVFTGLDAITSQVSLALEEAAHGEYGNALKHTLTSPIAPLQMLAEGKRIRDMAKAVSVGASFESMPAEVQNLLRAGGAITQDVRYSTGQVDAMKRAWNRGNPVWAAGHLPGAFLETMAKPIMEHWVPAIKIGMFAREAEFVLRRLGPDATGAEISHHLGRIWDSVENRMGQLRYDNLMWNRTMKDLGQVAVRSLGWNLGDIREIGGGIFDAGRTGARSVKNAEVEAKKTAARGEIRKAEGALAQAQQGGKPAEIEKAEAALRRAQAAMPSNLNDPVFTRRMAYSLAMPITVGTMGAIYYYGKHGKLPANIKDAFAIPTGGRNKDGSEERVFLPTYAKDVYAWAKDPFTTATHKLSPGVSIGAEIAKNQDYWGTQIREGNGAEQVRDSVEHAIRQMVPMSFRQILQSKFPGSNIGSGEALMGVTKAPASLSRSAAEEKLNEYLHRTSGGIKTKAEAEKSKARSEIKALIRGGHDEAADAAIEKAIEEHQVSPDEKQGRRALYKAAAKTVLENTLRSMPVDEALEVYRKATPEERQRWADAFRARVFGSASRRPSWWKDRPQEEVEAIQAEAEKLLPPE